MIRISEKSKSKLNFSLNESLVHLTTKLNESKFSQQTYLTLINDLESKLEQKEQNLGELDEKYTSLLSQQGSKKKEEKLNFESHKQMEIDELKRELTSLSEKYAEDKQMCESEIEKLNQSLSEKSNELEHCKLELERVKDLNSAQYEQIEELKENGSKLSELLESKEKTIELLKVSLTIRAENEIGSNGKSSLTSSANQSICTEIEEVQENNISFDSIMKIAELQMKIKDLEDSISSANVDYEQKNNECDNLLVKLGEKDLFIENLNIKLRDTEKTMKEHEMQIKLLNELREKDTKQHLKQMSEMDAQLKKKSSEAEKITPLLEQIRIKQERVQELEGQFSRIERQSNQERQTYEKQAHENWLTGRKIEKELKETKSELVVLKEKFNEVVAENNSLKQTLVFNQSHKMAAVAAAAAGPMFYMSPHQQHYNRRSMNETSADESQLNVTSSNTMDHDTSMNISKVTDHPLQIDTEQQRPPSSSSNPSHVSNNGGPSSTTMMPPASFPFMRPPPPFMFPPIPPPHAMAAYMQHQHQQQQQQIQLQQNIEPNISSPNPDYANRLHPNYSSQPPMSSGSTSSNYYNNKAIPATLSAASSQQPSPGANSTILQANYQRPVAYNANNTTSHMQASNSFLNESNASFASNFNISTIPNESDPTNATSVSSGTNTYPANSTNINTTQYNSSAHLNTYPNQNEIQQTNDSYNNENSNFNV